MHLCERFADLGRLEAQHGHGAVGGADQEAGAIGCPCQVRDSLPALLQVRLSDTPLNLREIVRQTATTH